MSATDLKPCPFCGKPAELTENEYSAPMVACEWCLARACSHSESLAIDKWNRRPIEDALRARAEAAEAERDALRARAEAAEALVAALRAEVEAGVALASALRTEVEAGVALAVVRAEIAEVTLTTARAEGASLRDQLDDALRRAREAEAALATARAEGAAAERAAIVARLREHREAAARLEGQCAYAGPDPSAAQCAWMWPDRPVEGA